MNPTDPRAQAAFAAAISHIKTTAAAVADRVADHLGTLASATHRIYERDALIGAQLDLRRHMSTFVLVFGDTLSKRLARELTPAGDSTRRLADTDWQSLSLVDDAEVEERMFADRIAQTITHECEWELRDVAAYAGTLLGIGRADQDRNPLRPEVVGSAVFKAIEAVSQDTEGRKLLARELGLALGRVMPSCYAEILKDLRARGIVPVSLSVRGVEGPGNELNRDRLNSGYSTVQRESSHSGAGDFGPTSHSQFDAGSTGRGGPGQRGGGGGPGGFGPGTGFDPGPGGTSAGFGNGTGGGASGGGSGGGFGGGSGAGPGSGNPSPAGGRSDPPTAGARPGGAPSSGRHAPSSRAGVSAQADAELMTLLRRLTSLATRPGELHNLTRPQGLSGSGGGVDIPLGTRAGDLATGSGGYADSLPGLMAVNLIRAHREELRQASTGSLDHMVIDVVGSLFDQILSDQRVPPQMARQIARLQLPVLRVALGDPTFFSSRKHPVRRFVNRIASLACAFEEFDEGPGKTFLTHVRDLVQEIVEGDFDQMDVYTAKLGELEKFIAQSAKQEVEGNAEAVSLVDSKESDLRVQQRYMLQLRAALAPMSMQDYLRDFLAQVWSQALAHASKRDGAQSDLAQRLRRVGRDLVLSVQPKGSPTMRKKFLMQLPMLMKDLNEGMALIGWPEAAQKSFFGQLLPAHAESLKGLPLSELEYNLLAKQLEAVFSTPVPAPDALLRDIPISGSGAPVEPHFSEEEKLRIGLIDESAVNWSGEIDIDLSGEVSTAPGGETQPGDFGGDTDSAPLDIDLSGLGIDIDLSSKEPAEPTQGVALMDHIRLGFAYQMNVNDQWQKVRLSYVSPGRAFFVFTRGKRHQETVSLTARMLSRLCETGRFKAFERAYLLERATARARKQLAALSASAKATTAAIGAKH